MRSKLAISALVIASMLGASAIASAQMQPAPGASSRGNVGPSASRTHKMKSAKMMRISKMKSGKMMRTSKIKSGTTTGMSSHSSKSDKAGKDSGGKD